MERQVAAVIVVVAASDELNFVVSSSSTQEIKATQQINWLKLPLV